MTEEIRATVGNAVRSLYQMILVVNDETLECQVVDYNEEMRNISDDITSFDLFCQDLLENIHPESRDEFSDFTNPDLFPKALEDKVYTSIECMIRHSDEEYYWSRIIFCHATKEDSCKGHDYLFLLQNVDAIKKKHLKEDAEVRAALKSLQDRYDKLFEENMTDQQTRCYNRKGKDYYSDIIIDEAKRTGKYVFVCMADLNGLKHLNDTYGHEAGDEAIREISTELLKAAPKGTRIVRMGGDEFLLIAALDKDSKEPEQMKEKLEAGLKKYNETHNNPFEVGTSYGSVLLPVTDDMEDLDRYISLADEKMYEMKKARDKYRRD
jgi:diguanylate cyclase (GGDEF)-like protein